MPWKPRDCMDLAVEPSELMKTPLSARSARSSPRSSTLLFGKYASVAVISLYLTSVPAGWLLGPKWKLFLSSNISARAATRHSRLRLSEVAREAVVLRRPGGSVLVDVQN